MRGIDRKDAAGARHGVLKGSCASQEQSAGITRAARHIVNNRGSKPNATLDSAGAIDWARDPFAGGAYSYPTPETRKAQLRLTSPEGGVVLFSGEALYRGRDMGTVEAALACGMKTAQTILPG